MHATGSGWHTKKNQSRTNFYQLLRTLGLHSPHTLLSLNLHEVPVPGSTLNDLNRDGRLQVCQFGQVGCLHSKDTARMISEICHCCCFFFSVELLPSSFLPTWLNWFFWQEHRGLSSRPGLDLIMIVTCTTPLEMPIRGLFFDMGMGLMAGSKSGFSPVVKGLEPKWGSILMNKHRVFSNTLTTTLNFSCGTRFSFL